MTRSLIFIITYFYFFNLFTQNVGEVLLNEVITDPQQDWSSTGFEVGASPALGAGSNDEAIELLILVDGLDLTNWTIELNDGTDISGDLTSTGAFAVSNYISSSGGVFSSTKSGDYLVLGNVVGGGNINNTSLTIILRSPNGDVIDEVSLGGQAGKAPSGNATSIANQSISRIINGTNSGDDSVDFIKTVTTLGEVNRYASVSEESGNALLLNGSNAFVETEYLGVLGGNDRTFECWVKSSSDGTIFCYGQNNANEANIFSVTNGLLTFSINGVEVVGSTSVIDDEWHHIALVLSGNDILNVLFYIDGIVDSFSSSSVGTLNTVSSQGLLVGKGFSGNYFNGTIDEVRFWAVARTQREIRSCMHLTLVGNEEGLEVYYQFNQTSGNALEVMRDMQGELEGDFSYVTSGVHVGRGQVTIHTVSSLGTYSSNSTIAEYSLDIDFLTVHSNGELVVSYLVMSPLGTSPSDENHSSGTWIIHNYGTVTTGLDYSSKFRFNDGALNSSDLVNYTLSKRGSNETGSWIGVGSTCDVGILKGDNYVTFCGIDGFSQFVVSSPGSPLPVSFLNVGAKQTVSGSIAVLWSTINEKNNDFFTIEKSTDAKYFYAIGELTAVGEGFVETDYTFEDISVVEGAAYYRVKQTDFNGNFSYSKIFFLDVVIELDFVVYPNPVKEQLFISLDDDVSFELLSSDLVIQEISSVRLDAKFMLDVSFLPRGIYFLRLSNGQKTKMERIFILD